MKTAMKRLTFSVSSMGLAFFALSGIYNSAIIKNDSFMAMDSGVKFVKRLDEITGKVTFGRMAASTEKWTNLKPKKVEVKKEVIKKVAIKKDIEVKKEVQNIPEPAIKGDLDLTATNIFFKKPLKQGSFSGSARTVDGVIEEIFVNLPEGDQIVINTRDRMVGNVFQYEDTETREMKSGMLYEVKPGKYMVTLTNDSRYAGVRMEFASENNTQIAYSEEYYQSTQSWGLDKQNENKKEDSYSQNDRPQNDYNNDNNYDQNNYEENSQNVSGFNFNPQG